MLRFLYRRRTSNFLKQIFLWHVQLFIEFDVFCAKNVLIQVHVDIGNISGIWIVQIESLVFLSCESRHGARN